MGLSSCKGSLPAHSVASFIPAKVSNFLVKHRGVDPSAMLKWANENTEWPDQLKSAVRDPVRFELVVEAMAKQMKRPH
jgi:hypothetical protein